MAARDGRDRARALTSWGGGRSERAECLDETLAQANAVLRILEHRRLEIERAVRSSDENDLVRLSVVLRVLARRIPEIRLAAWRCPGTRTTEREGRVRVEVVRVEVVPTR